MEMGELYTVFVIESSKDLYVLEDEIYNGEILDGVIELATQFDSREEAEEFLVKMEKSKIKGEVKEAKIYIKVID